MKRNAVFMVLIVCFRLQLSESLPIIIARCRANCLHKIAVADREDKSDAAKLLKQCWSDCRAIPSKLQARLTNCNEICNEKTAIDNKHRSTCLRSCEFILFSIKQGKSGFCPEAATGFALADVSHCQSDFDCHGDEKCCQNEGGKWTCHTISFKWNRDLPEIPTNITAIKRKGKIVLTWNRIQSMQDTKVIFVIQQRSSMTRLSPHPDEMSFWNYATSSRTNSAIISNLSVNTWYQFRLVAVSKDGHNGYSAPTSPFFISGDIRRPSPPMNFNVIKTILSGGKVDVTVAWQEPEFMDAPLKIYKIIWLKDMDSDGHRFIASIERKMRVNPDCHNATIDGLDQASTYMFEIQAVLVGKRGKRIKGERSKIKLKTPGISATSSSSLPRRNVITDSRISNTSTIALNVSKVVFDQLEYGVAATATLNWTCNGSISGLNIWYKPLNCSSNTNLPSPRQKFISTNLEYFKLQYLKPFCIYEVKVTPFYKNLAGKEMSITFETDFLSTPRGKNSNPHRSTKDSNRRKGVQHSNSISFKTQYLMHFLLFIPLFFLLL